MTDIVATTPGLYPLPDWAKDELAELKGHQKSDLISGDEATAVSEAYDRAREEIIDRQAAAGLDAIVEGQLRWDDMLAHPLAVHDNVETRGIVRYYDNNNFYREPVIRGELTPDGDVAAELDAAADLTDDLQAVLPGPYSLADLATDEHYGDDLLEAVASFLADEAAAFPALDSLWLLEPSLVTASPTDREVEPARVRAAIDRVAGAVPAEVVIHTYWGALEGATYAGLLDADIDAIGVDLIRDPTGTRETVEEYGVPDAVALGVVDGQNTRVEEPATLRSRVDRFVQETAGEEVDTVYATVNTELFYLPVSSAAAKLEALAHVTEEVTA